MTCPRASIIGNPWLVRQALPADHRGAVHIFARQASKSETAWADFAPWELTVSGLDPGGSGRLLASGQEIKDISGF